MRVSKLELNLLGTASFIGKEPEAASKSFHQASMAAIWVIQEDDQEIYQLLSEWPLILATT